MAELFTPEDENTAYFSRLNADELLGTYCDFSFLLDGKLWPTVEHYISAMQFENNRQQEKIRCLETAALATRAGKWSWFKRQRPNWNNLRVVYMTRGVYTRCKTHDEVRKRLLDTADARLVENSQYDYYWGCGRDRRGENMYGKVLMNVRQKLQDEASQ